MLNINQKDILKFTFISLIIMFVLYTIIQSGNRVLYLLGIKDNPKDKIIKLQNKKIENIVNVNRDMIIKHKEIIDNLDKDFNDTINFTKYNFKILKEDVNITNNLEDKKIEIKKEMKDKHIKPEPKLTIMKPINTISLFKPVTIKEKKKIMKESLIFYTKKDKIKREIEYNNSKYNISIIWRVYQEVNNE